MDKPKWLIIAEGELGEKEIPGPKDNKEILEYFKTTTYPATHDEVPWCSAFANWCMKKAGIVGSKSAAAVSWLHWGDDLGEHPKLGCIVLFEWDSGGHHVAFYVGPDGEDRIKCLGGNQGDMVKVSSFPVANVMTYRWPKG